MFDILFKGKSVASGIIVYGTPILSVNDRAYMIHGATEDAINTINELDFIYSEVVPDTVKPVTKTRVSCGEIPGVSESDINLPKLDRVEKVEILKALKSCNGFRKEAANMLGISERTLYRKLREYKESSKAK